MQAASNDQNPTRLQVEFANCREIRMGSPYNACDLQLRGKWLPHLPNVTWQDRSAHSPDSRYIALVYWDIVNNQPGFRVVVIDTIAKTVSEHDRIEGCCDRLWWDDQGLHWRVF